MFKTYFLSECMLNKGTLS